MVLNCGVLSVVLVSNTQLILVVRTWCRGCMLFLRRMMARPSGVILANLFQTLADVSYT